MVVCLWVLSCSVDNNLYNPRLQYQLFPDQKQSQKEVQADFCESFTVIGGTWRPAATTHFFKYVHTNRRLYTVYSECSHCIKFYSKLLFFFLNTEASLLHFLFLGYLALYVVYVVTVIISAYIYNRQKHSVNSDVRNIAQIPGKKHNKQIHTHTNTNNVSKYPVMIFSVFAAEFHSSDSSDDDVPCLNSGAIQQEYGRNTAPFFYKPQYKLMFSCMIRTHKMHVHVCVFQSQSTGHCCLTLSPRVRYCWALWTRWTTGSGGGNHGVGECSK